MLEHLCVGGSFCHASLVASTLYCAVRHTSWTFAIHALSRLTTLAQAIFIRKVVEREIHALWTKACNYGVSLSITDWNKASLGTAGLSPASPQQCLPRCCQRNWCNTAPCCCQHYCEVLGCIALSTSCDSSTRISPEVRFFAISDLPGIR